MTKLDIMKIAQSAYVSIHKSGLPPDYIVAAPLTAKRMAAMRFAQAVTKQMSGTPAVIIECTLPKPGYLSWLLLRPLGIAFDSSQVRAGVRAKRQNVPPDETQIARAILHELGHIFATPELLARRQSLIVKDGKTFAPPGTPLEEERAWVWAMSVFGIAMGYYARRRRECAFYDDAMTLCV